MKLEKENCVLMPQKYASLAFSDAAVYLLFMLENNIIISVTDIKGRNEIIL